ncbi:hypothetical protein V492_01748 [Pseudogymnoascus sp. VKM F-4246]|nr:hypothetical protein V492_01748 [Pseudogymnoascus sp. VKM F-4246]
MSATKPELPEYTSEQVAAHKHEDDLWIIVHGKVYDVTKYIPDHPGGDDILIEIGGADGSEEFDAAGHSDDAFDIAGGLLVGTLKMDENNMKQKRRRPETARLISSTPSPPPEKEQRRVPSRAIIALSVGLGSSIACLGLWLNAKQYDIAALPNPLSFATEWLWAAGTVKRKGFGFTEGVLFTSATFSLTVGTAIQRLAKVLSYHSQYRPHKKVPRMPKRNMLNGRGWLDSTVFQKLPLTKKELLAPDTYRFVFALPTSDTVLGLPIGQHVSIRGLVDGKLVSRSYTPVSNNTDRGVLELIVRCYAKGALTNVYLRELQLGDEVEFRGPKGGIRYQPGMCEKMDMVAGGTGITPMYQLIRAVCENPRDTTEINLIYANRTEQDILLRDELDNFARKYPRNLKIFYVLEQTPVKWNGGSGYVTKEMMEERFAVSSPTTKVFLCGPPPMVDSVKKSLNDLGFKLPGAITKPGDSILCF